MRRAESRMMDALNTLSLSRNIINIILNYNDISTNKNNNPHYGIFGLAFLEGESCVISSFRLNKLNNLFYLRLSKVAVHEIGHTIGLYHCESSEKCFMTSAKGKLKTIDKEELKLCDNCRKIIGLKQ